jgi:hypothetical protein
VRYGFLDEAGDVGYTPGATDHFIVVVIVVGYPERLRKAVRKTRKALGKRIRNIPELKAAGGDPRVTEKLLTHAVEIGFDTVAVVIDKRRFPQPRDHEDLYRYACARVVRESVSRFGSLTLTLDKRYTTPDLRRQLNDAIVREVEHLKESAVLVIEHEDSKDEQILQVADAVAWALFQRYERGEDSLWRIIQGNVTEVNL